MDAAAFTASAGRGIVPRGIYRIVLTHDLCKACGLCVAWCPQRVLASDELGYPVVARSGDCVDCKACERHCPDFAIEVIPPAPSATRETTP